MEGKDREICSGCEQVQREHKKISEMMFDLERWLAAPSDAEGSWTEALRGRLVPMAEVLKPHFAGEEASGFYKEVPIEFPRFARTLNRLMGEHQLILDELEGIIGDAEGAGEPPERQLRELTLRTSILLAMLRTHESEEDEVLQQAYWDDVPAGD